MKKIAIYTRKSKFTGKGESIENQIIKCKQFIQFKFEDIAEDNIEIFIDEGFSGKNENRPRYQDMIRQVKEKQIDKIVIYQLNRLGRNARDIHNTMQMCDDLDCIIYSATEGFDSSTSFGRAIIGILASLAQLEREQLAERVKDNMYTLAKMGRWLGGQSPLGFNGIKEYYIDENGRQRYITKLKKNNDEIKVVKLIFKKYLEEKSLSQVGKWALTNNLKGKNGADLSKGSINAILQNPVYVKSNTDVISFLKKEGYEVCGEPNENGLLRYAQEGEKIVSVSNHKGIIDAADWLEIQNTLKANVSKAPKLGKTSTALLTGILKCECGSGMNVTYGHPLKNGTIPFYYTCSMKINSGGTRCSSKNINGLLLEDKLIKYLKLYSEETLIAKLLELSKNSDKIDFKAQQQNIDSEIEKSNKAISKLFSKLKLTEDDEISKMLMDEIKKEKTNIKVLSKKREELINDEADLTISKINIQNVITTLNTFKNTFDDMDLKGKQKILKELISSIKIDGDNFLIDFNIKKN